MKVANKVIVVTGGGDGIGRQLVLELLRRGARVAAVDLNKSALEQTERLAAADQRLRTFELDITDRQGVEALPQQVLAAFGQVDGIINNAGIIQPFVRIADLDYDVIERVINVNLYGTIHVLKAFLPLLQARPVAHVTNVSSMGGFLPVPGQAIYGATKAGVKLLSEALYSELLETQVGVTCVMPGGVNTNITENSGVDMPVADPDAASKYTTTEADEAARMIVDAIEDDRLHLYVGRDSRLMNLASRAAPRRATELIQRQMKNLLPT